MELGVKLQEIVNKIMQRIRANYIITLAQSLS